MIFKEILKCQRLNLKQVKKIILNFHIFFFQIVIIFYITEVIFKKIYRIIILKNWLKQKMFKIQSVNTFTFLWVYMTQRINLIFFQIGDKRN